MNHRTLRLIAALATLVTAQAFAQEADLVEKVAVKNRLFTVSGRPEIGANAGFTLLSKLTEHYNFNVSVAYNVVDWFALELRAGFGAGASFSVITGWLTRWGCTRFKPASILVRTLSSSISLGTERIAPMLAR